MTPVQKVAMGLVLVVVDAWFAGFDAVPDLLGWVLVLLGLHGLRTALPSPVTLTALAALAGVVSLALLSPSLLADTPESTLWLVSLPQTLFCLVLAGAMAALLGPPRPDLARRFGVLRWVFVLVAVLPVLMYGGGVDGLLVPTAVVAVAASVYLVYLLFRVPADVVAPARPAADA